MPNSAIIDRLVAKTRRSDLAEFAPGDTVLEVQGILVAGAKADVLKAAMQKAVGETLRVKIQRGAEIREVSLIAVNKPPAQ